MDEIGLKEQVQHEIAKYRQFSYGVLGKATEFDTKPLDADVRNYAKYVLAHGTKDEKREILSCLKSRIEIKDRAIQLRVIAELKR